MSGVLQSLVIDVEHDITTRARRRAPAVAKMYVNEVILAAVHGGAGTSPNSECVASQGELMIVGPVTVRSACSHHLCPIMAAVSA